MTVIFDSKTTVFPQKSKTSHRSTSYAEVDNLLAVNKL